MKVVIELKLQDAHGLGGEMMRKMGFKPMTQPGRYVRSVVAEADDDDTDPDVQALPYVERLLDAGIRPRRVQTEVRSIGAVTMGSVDDGSTLHAAIAALGDASGVLRAIAPIGKRIVEKAPGWKGKHQPSIEELAALPPGTVIVSDDEVYTKIDEDTDYEGGLWDRPGTDRYTPAEELPDVEYRIKKLGAE